MQRLPFRIVSVLVPPALATFVVTQVSAAELCDVAQADRRPIEALKARLEGQGWQVSLEEDEGCQEAYTIDDKGARVERYHDPQAFEVVREI